MKHKLIAFSLVAAAFSGCTEQKEMEFPPIDGSGYTLIMADIESLLLMEDNRVWPDSAAIGVYGSEKGNNEYYTIKNAGAGYSSAEFYGPVVKGDIAAYYPYSSGYVASADAMPVTIEAVQDFDPEKDVVSQYLEYTPKAFGYMNDGKINFVYPAGVLNLAIGSDEPITVTDLNLVSDTLSIAGLAVFKADGSLEMTSSSSSSVLLNCNDQPIAKGKETDFYMVLAPGTYSDLRLEMGFKGYDKKFVCPLPEVTIERISAEGFKVSSMKFTLTVPDGFEEVEMEFDE